jgi:prolyl 4-hydroxylase
MAPSLSFYERAEAFRFAPGFPETPPLVLSESNPKAYLVRNFLTDEECDHLMALAKKQLAPSTVVSGTGEPVGSEVRTSAGMFLSKHQDAVVRDIEFRIAALSGTPEDNGEGMQILRYDIGQKYDAHFDYFHDEVNRSPKRGGQRIATMLIYLVDTEEGGETIFPNAKRPEHFNAEEPNNPFAKSIKHSSCVQNGLPVASVRGDAVLFFSVTGDGELDRGSLHGACPVITGQKWTAVKWIRMDTFDGGFTTPREMIPLTRRTPSQTCVDEWDECARWARDGWCDKNPRFMRDGTAGARDNKGPACAKSCNVCAP